MLSREKISFNFEHILMSAICLKLCLLNIQSCLHHRKLVNKTKDKAKKFSSKMSHSLVHFFWQMNKIGTAGLFARIFGKLISFGGWCIGRNNITRLISNRTAYILWEPSHHFVSRVWSVLSNESLQNFIRGLQKLRIKLIKYIFKHILRGLSEKRKWVIKKEKKTTI